MIFTETLPNSRPARILVIGANGQFGTALTEALVQRHGRDAVITADLSADSRLPGLAHEWLDAMDRSALKSALQRHNVTQVYHLAAGLCRRGEEHPGWVWPLNVAGLMNVLECARLHNVERVFWPSSHAVFGPRTPQAMAPQHTVTEPTTLYGITKVAGEGLCDWYRRTHKLDVRCLRLPGLVSWQTPSSGEVTDYASAMFHAALSGEHFICNLDAHSALPLMYMPDAVAATLQLMEHPVADLGPSPPAYNVMSCSVTPMELALELQKYRSTFTVEYRPDPLLQAIADGWPISVDQDAAWRDWAWAPEYNLSFMVAHMLRHQPATGPGPLPTQPAHHHVPEADQPAN